MQLYQNCTSITLLQKLVGLIPLQCQVLPDIQPLKKDVEYSQIYGMTEQQHQVVGTSKTYLGLRDERLGPATQGQDLEDLDQELQ